MAALIRAGSPPILLLSARPTYPGAAAAAELVARVRVELSAMAILGAVGRAAGRVADEP